MNTVTESELNTVQFSPHGRGTRGQKAYRVTDKTGELIGVLAVKEEDELVCITSQGNTLKLGLKNISVMGKNAQGVRVVNIKQAGFSDWSLPGW